MAQKIFDQLYTAYGERNVLLMACRELTRVRQCQAFYKQYLSYLATKGDVIDPEDAGKETMVHAIDQFAPVVRKRWERAIPEIFE